MILQYLDSSEGFNNVKSPLRTVVEGATGRGTFINATDEFFVTVFCTPPADDFAQFPPFPLHNPLPPPNLPFRIHLFIM